MKKLSTKDECKIRTYSNLGLQSYISRRFGADEPVRIAVFPFDVPETFAYREGVSSDFGVELSNRVKAELVRSEEPYIVEYFSDANWAGKKDDFNEGNYHALNLAAQAGYDLVVLGSLVALNPISKMELQTKIVDISTGMTIFWASTAVHSSISRLDTLLIQWNFIEHNAADFRLGERADKLVRCTTRAMMTTEGIAMEQDELSDEVNEGVDAETQHSSPQWVDEHF